MSFKLPFNFASPARHYAGWFAACLLLASCANLLGPRDIGISLTRLQDGLATRFPYQQRFAQIFDVTLRNPVLTMIPDANRVAIDMDAQLGVPFVSKTLQGRLGMSGQLQIDMARNAIMLIDTRIERFTMNGAQDNAYSGQLARIGDALTQQWLREIPIYTFRPEDLQYAGVRFTPTKITTTPSGLVVTFDPVK